MDTPPPKSSGQDDFDPLSRQVLIEAFLPHAEQIYARAKVMCYLMMAGVVGFILIALVTAGVVVVKNDWSRLPAAVVALGCATFVFGAWGKLEGCNAAFANIRFCVHCGTRSELNAAIGKLTCYGSLRTLLKDVLVLKSLATPGDAGRAAGSD